MNVPDWLQGSGVSTNAASRHGASPAEKPPERPPVYPHPGVSGREENTGSSAMTAALKVADSSTAFIEAIARMFGPHVFSDVDAALAAAQTHFSPSWPHDELPGGGSGDDAVAALTQAGASLITAIRELENAKNAAAAAQAQAEVLFAAVERARQLGKGVTGVALGRGTGAQIALARRESPFVGLRRLKWATRLVREFPQVSNMCSNGVLSEYRAQIIVTEAEFLSSEQRRHIDAALTSGDGELESLGNKQLAAAVRTMAYAMEPAAFVKRLDKAESERCVTLRPAADGMTYLSALLPLRQGVTVLKTLTQIADSARAKGEARGKGQIMADALVHRLTSHRPCASPSGQGDGEELGSDAGTQGQGGAGCLSAGEQEIHLDLIMTDRALFDGASDPALLTGYQPIPAPTARQMIINTAGAARVWLRRLYTHPDTGELLTMDSKARLFPDGMKRFLFDQDQLCATAYCDAPIREYDHIKSYAAGGPTSISNGQGLCQGCNQNKEAQGWSSQPGGTITTPTGHRYASVRPTLPGGNQEKRKTVLGE
ncbi:HNH endonuclease [Arthrobacter sp. HLT1-20]